MKITPSLLLNIILVTILTTSFFLVNTTANYKTTSTGEYDPWIDTDDDGDIDIYDIVRMCNAYGTTGIPINKTELLLDLLDRVEALETRTPKKGYISISPAAFISARENFEYNLHYTMLYASGWYYADVQLPDGVIVTKMSAYVFDASELFSGSIQVTLHEHNLPLGSGTTMADVWTESGEAPGHITLNDTTIESPDVDTRNCVYVLEVLFGFLDFNSLRFKGVTIEYEYQE